MSIIVTRRLPDGSFVELSSDGTSSPSVAETNWSHLDGMTEEETDAAALGDIDNPPLTDQIAKRRTRLPQTRVIRRALGLTQEEFAARYDIPVGTLRDWEQGRAVPDQPARAYLRAIAGDPAGVQRALETGPTSSA
jgi:putative transcriptional regulator